MTKLAHFVVIHMTRTQTSHYICNYAMNFLLYLPSFFLSGKRSYTCFLSLSLLPLGGWVKGAGEWGTDIRFDNSPSLPNGHCQSAKSHTQEVSLQAGKPIVNQRRRLRRRDLGSYSWPGIINEFYQLGRVKTVIDKYPTASRRVARDRENVGSG